MKRSRMGATHEQYGVAPRPQFNGSCGFALVVRERREEKTEVTTSSMPVGFSTNSVEKGAQHRRTGVAPRLREVLCLAAYSRRSHQRNANYADCLVNFAQPRRCCYTRKS